MTFARAQTGRSGLEERIRGRAVIALCESDHEDHPEADDRLDEGALRLRGCITDDSYAAAKAILSLPAADEPSKRLSERDIRRRGGAARSSGSRCCWTSAASVSGKSLSRE